MSHELSKNHDKKSVYAVRSLNTTHQYDFDRTDNVHGRCQCGTRIKQQPHRATKFWTERSANIE